MSVDRSARHAVRRRRARPRRSRSSSSSTSDALSRRAARASPRSRRCASCCTSASRRSVTVMRPAAPAQSLRGGRPLQRGRDDDRAGSDVAARSRWTACVWPRSAPRRASCSIVGGAFLYQATAQSSRVLAAELAADHVKCFAMNAVLGTHQSPDDRRRARWRPASAGTCGCRSAPSAKGSSSSGRGPACTAKARSRTSCTATTASRCRCSCCRAPTRPEQLVEVLGHECAIWSVDRSHVRARLARDACGRAAARRVRARGDALIASASRVQFARRSQSCECVGSSRCSAWPRWPRSR